MHNIKRFTIGFGDGNDPCSGKGSGYVYFENITVGYGNADVPFNEWPVYLTEDPFVNGYTHWRYLLKQDCPLIDKGCDYIDQTRLIGKTTAIDGAPDSNIVDIGFHYIHWHYVNAGDGNTLNADLKQDGVVNFGDFVVLADGWLTNYDINDLNKMADEWLETAEPNVQLSFTEDANIGIAEFSAGGTLLNTQRIFLLIDGQYAGEVPRPGEECSLEVDISELGGGEHQLKAVSIDYEGKFTSSKITNTTFVCPLNYCMLPSEYEPNKPLYFSAFNPSEGDVTVNAYADVNVVWSQTYSGDSILGSIPAEVTLQYDFDYISFAPISGGAISKVADPEPSNSEVIRALIILPNLKMIKRDARTISQVQSAFRERGIDCKTLSGKNASYKKIAKCVKENTINYMYLAATHSNIGYDFKERKYLYCDGALITCVLLYGNEHVVSINRSDPLAPSWCHYEGKFKSFYAMGFYYLEFAYFDTCYSGRLKISNEQLIEGRPGEIGQAFDGPYSDMSWALGMQECSKDRVYQGWFSPIPEGNSPGEPEYQHQKWTRNVWKALGEGNNLAGALYTASQQDGYPDGTFRAPNENFRLKGQGFIYGILLRNN